MDTIFVAYYNAVGDLISDAFKNLIRSNHDFEISGEYSSLPVLGIALKKVRINILVFVVRDINDHELSFIRKSKDEYPSVKTLVISLTDDPEHLYAIIKSGAKGYLTCNSNRNEFYQAIYSLRNGYDFYSKPITDLLLKNYADVIKSNDISKAKYLKNLSIRELEILRYWGNGMTNKEIADEMFISIRTVESHKNHIMQKLNLKTIVDLVKFAIKNNIITI